MCPTFADGLQLRGSDCRGDRPSLPRGERGVPDRHDAGHVADSNPSYQRKHTNRAGWSRCSGVEGPQHFAVSQPGNCIRTNRRGRNLRVRLERRLQQLRPAHVGQSIPAGGQARSKWVSVFDAQEEKLVHGQNQMIVNLEVSGGSGSPAPVPGVSGLGAGCHGTDLGWFPVAILPAVHTGVAEFL